MVLGVSSASACFGPVSWADLESEAGGERLGEVSRRNRTPGGPGLTPLNNPTKNYGDSHRASSFR